MTALYRIENKVGLVPEKKISDAHALYVEVHTPKEFLDVELEDNDIKEAVHLLSYSHGSFVNMFPGCIIGSLSFVNKVNLLKIPSHFAFCLSPKRLIFIDSTTSCQKTLESLVELHALSNISCPRILLEFIKYNIKDDMPFLSSQEKKLEELEAKIIDEDKEVSNHQLLSHRRRLLSLTRLYQQLADITTLIGKDEPLILAKDDRRLFKLVSHQATLLFERAQYLKEYNLQLHELYQAQISIQQNQTIRWLTVITTLFVPLTLITSWYGMNFGMPEISWPYSYGIVIAVCIILVIVQLAFFKKRKWL